MPHVLLQQLAFQLLDHLHLFALWETYGQPLLVGSLVTGLMTEPNIDLNIVMEKPDLAAGFAVLRAVAKDTHQFRKLYLSNHLDDPHPTLYVGFDYAFGGEVWIVDQLLFGSDHPQRMIARQTTLALQHYLTPQLHQRILQIKHERLQTHGLQMGGGSGLESLDIYRAVCDGQATSYTACRDWAAQHPRSDYSDWMPISNIE